MSGFAVTLVFEAGPEAGKSLKLGTPKTTIGRRKGEILIKDAEISGSHAEINVAGQKVSIKDLGSTNGTFVNGKKLPAADLKDGDRLTIGQSKIVVKIDAGAPAAKPAAAPVRPAARQEPAPRPAAQREAPPEARQGRDPAMARTQRAPEAPLAPAKNVANGGGRRNGQPNAEGIGALISEELEGFSEQTDSVIMDLARADEELKLPYRTNLYFEVIEGPDAGMKTQFSKGNMVIGRLNADVVLKDSDISRRHALVEAYTRDKIFIKDLASTNGTFVNGQKVTYDKLKHGDKVRVGKTVLKFLVEELK
jgi:pSer/pThr/pTyr-binding forkhead associated (FHA) protein